MHRLYSTCTACTVELCSVGANGVHLCINGSFFSFGFSHDRLEGISGYPYLFGSSCVLTLASVFLHIHNIYKFWLRQLFSFYWFTRKGPSMVMLQKKHSRPTQCMICTFQGILSSPQSLSRSTKTSIS